MSNKWTDVEKKRAEWGRYVNEYFISFADQKGNFISAYLQGQEYCNPKEKVFSGYLD